MDPIEVVPNVVDIAIDRLEEFFEAAAVPGFTGSVEVSIRLLPQAGYEVEYNARRQTVEQLNSSKEQAHALSSNHRVNMVRQKIAEWRPRLRVFLPVLSMTGHYMNGELRSFETTDTGFGLPKSTGVVKK